MTSALRDLEEQISLLNKDIMNLGTNDNIDEANLNLEIKIRGVIEDAESVTYREGDVYKIQEILHSCEELLNTLNLVYLDEINGRKDKVLKNINEKLSKLENEVQDYNIIINQCDRLESEINSVFNKLNQIDVEVDEVIENKEILHMRCKKLLQIVENYKEQSVKAKESLSENDSSDYITSDTTCTTSDEDEAFSTCSMHSNDENYGKETSIFYIPSSIILKVEEPNDEKALKENSTVDKPMSKIKVPDIFQPENFIDNDKNNDDKIIKKLDVKTLFVKENVTEVNRLRKRSIHKLNITDIFPDKVVSQEEKKIPIKAIKKLHFPEAFLEKPSSNITEKNVESPKPIRKLNISNIFSDIGNDETDSKIKTYSKTTEFKKINLPEIFNKNPNNLEEKIISPEVEKIAIKKLNFPFVFVENSSNIIEPKMDNDEIDKKIEKNDKMTEIKKINVPEIFNTNANNSEDNVSIEDKKALIKKLNLSEFFVKNSSDVIKEPLELTKDINKLNFTNVNSKITDNDAKTKKDDKGSEIKKINVPEIFVNYTDNEKTYSKTETDSKPTAVQKINVPEIFNKNANNLEDILSTEDENSPTKKLNLPEIFVENLSDIIQETNAKEETTEIKVIKKLDTENIFLNIQQEGEQNKAMDTPNISKIKIPDNFTNKSVVNELKEPREAKIPKIEDTITQEKLIEKNRLFEKFALYKFFPEESQHTENKEKSSEKPKIMSDFNEEIIAVRISNMSIDDSPSCQVDLSDKNFDKIFNENIKSDENLEVYENIFQALTADINVQDVNIDKRFKRMFKQDLK